MTVHLVRHGESRWNAAGLLQGQTSHVALTDLGVRQARAAGELLRGLPVGLVLSSDLTRAAQTARAIAAVVGAPVRLDPRLREQHHGSFQGGPSAVHAAAWAVAHRDGFDPHVRLGGGESAEDVRRRVWPLLRWCADAASDVVLVTHGETIRAVLGHGIPLPPNGSVRTVVLR